MAKDFVEDVFDFERCKLAGPVSVPRVVGGRGALFTASTGSIGALSPIPSSAIGSSANPAASQLLNIPVTLASLWGAPTTKEALNVPTPRRTRELHFRETKRDLFISLAGQWVCLEGETVVAHGFNVAKVVEETRRRGVQVPYVFRVSDEPEGSVRMGL
jgi:hypothetical protein